MKRTLRRLTINAAVIFLAVAFIMVYARFLGPWLSLKYLEYQVKRNVDPNELQQWATNLLMLHPNSGMGKGQHYYYDFYGTNLPAGLKKVKGYNHAVIVWQNNVWLFCGPKGGPFLAVGSSNFFPKYALPTYEWKPGIFFVKQD